MKTFILALVLFYSLAPALSDAKEYKIPPTPAEYREYKKCMERTGDKVTCSKISLSRFFVCYDNNGNPAVCDLTDPYKGKR